MEKQVEEGEDEDKEEHHLALNDEVSGQEEAAPV